jgi:hypothetical protein
MTDIITCQNTDDPSWITLYNNVVGDKMYGS